MSLFGSPCNRKPTTPHPTSCCHPTAQTGPPPMGARPLRKLQIPYTSMFLWDKASSHIPSHPITTTPRSLSPTTYATNVCKLDASNNPNVIVWPLVSVFVHLDPPPYTSTVASC